MAGVVGDFRPPNFVCSEGVEWRGPVLDQTPGPDHQHIVLGLQSGRLQPVFPPFVKNHERFQSGQFWWPVLNPFAPFQTPQHDVQHSRMPWPLVCLYLPGLRPVLRITCIMRQMRCCILRHVQCSVSHDVWCVLCVTCPALRVVSLFSLTDGWDLGLSKTTLLERDRADRFKLHRGPTCCLRPVLRHRGI